MNGYNEIALHHRIPAQKLIKHSENRTVIIHPDMLMSRFNIVSLVSELFEICDYASVNGCLYE